MATPLTSKHRWFVYLPIAAFPDNTTVLLTKPDFTTFGIPSSRAHALWSIIPAADYADDPRAKAIAKAAARLSELRENWLNPPDLVKRVLEVVPGFAERILPVDEATAAILKKRTLTNSL